MMIMAMTIVVVVMGAVEMTIMTMVMIQDFSLDLPCQSPSNSFWYTFCYTHSNSKI